MISTVTIRPTDAKALTLAQKHLRAAQDQRTNTIVRAAENGATLREIAEAVGLSYQRVDQILKDAESKHKVARPRPGGSDT